MPDIDRQFYLDEIRRAWVTGRIDKHTALQRLQEQFGDPTAEAMRFVDEKYNREDDVASAITGTPYLSIKVPMDPYHPVYVPREHTNHGTEQSYQRSCQCGVCHAYADARIKGRPNTVTFGPEGRTYDVACPVHGSTHCYHPPHDLQCTQHGVNGCTECFAGPHGFEKPVLPLAAGQKLFTEPTGHTPSYECSCKDCLKKLGPFPLEDQVAPLMEASKLSEHDVRVMLWKSWLDLNPELKPVRQDRAAQEKKVTLQVARRTTATFSWLLSVGCFLGLIIGLAISSTPLCAMSFAGFMTTLLASLLLGPPTLRMPKLWSPKMGYPSSGILSALGGLAFGIFAAIVAFAVVLLLYACAMAVYIAVFGRTPNWPF